jgi:simple sugar transport system permease protein
MSATFFIHQVILCMIPLMIVALAGAFAEHSGIINLALEGGMIFGAFIGAVFCIQMKDTGVAALSSTSQLTYFLALLVSALAGALFSLLLSFSAINMEADQTIAGTALNMLAPAIVNTFGLLLFHQERIYTACTFVLTKELSYSNMPKFQQAVTDSPFLQFFFDKVYISTYLVILLFILLSVWLYKSKTGTHLRACGENPQAAASVGINVYRMRYLGTTISGALAGLGGFVYIATEAAVTAESSVAGLGFLALAIMIFGNWKPLTIALGALLFGFIQCVGVLHSQIPFMSSWKLPFYFYNMLPYIIILIVLILTHRKSGMPKAEGIPYDKGKR